MLSTKNLRLRRFCKKIFDKFIESFKITEFIEKLTYRLQLLEKYQRLHSVFHIALLEFYRERKHDKRFEDFLSNLMNDQQKYKIEEILDKIDQNEKILYLIK